MAGSISALDMGLCPVCIVLASRAGFPETAGEVMDRLAVTPGRVTAVRVNDISGFRRFRNMMTPGENTRSLKESAASDTSESMDGLLARFREEGMPAASISKDGVLADEVSKAVLHERADMALLFEEPGAKYSVKQLASDGARVLAQTRKPVFLVPATWTPRTINMVLMILDGCKEHPHLLRGGTKRVHLLTDAGILVAGVSSTSYPLLTYLRLSRKGYDADGFRQAREISTGLALEEAKRIADELRAAGARTWSTALVNHDAHTIADLARSSAASVVCRVMDGSAIESRRANSLALTKLLEAVKVPVLLLPVPRG